MHEICRIFGPRALIIISTPQLFSFNFNIIRTTSNTIGSTINTISSNSTSTIRYIAAIAVPAIPVGTVATLLATVPVAPTVAATNRLFHPLDTSEAGALGPNSSEAAAVNVPPVGSIAAATTCSSGLLLATCNSMHLAGAALCKAQVPSSGTTAAGSCRYLLATSSNMQQQSCSYCARHKVPSPCFSYVPAPRCRAMLLLPLAGPAAKLRVPLELAHVLTQPKSPCTTCYCKCYWHWSAMYTMQAHVCSIHHLQAGTRCPRIRNSTHDKHCFLFGIGHESSCLRHSCRDVFSSTGLGLWPSPGQQTTCSTYIRWHHL